MASVSLRIRGTDSLGVWNAHEGNCLVCGQHGLVMRYARLTLKHFIEENAPAYKDLDWEVIISSTIMGKAFPEGMTWGQGCGTLGITCGCYSKFHRQLTHIVERWRGAGRQKQQAKVAAARAAARKVGR